MAIDYKSVQSKFGPHLEKYVNFASWARWFPDLFLDLCRPSEGGITLHTDQRVFMRSLARFYSTYGCLPRGSSKSFNQVAVLYVLAIWFPNITLSVTAQTRESAVKLLKDKHNEIMNAWPILQNEMPKKPKFTSNDAEVYFKSGARVDALANSQSSKGQRRKRVNAEESVLMDNFTFQDAVEPIVEVPRYTCGKLAVVDPCELNQQINFFTTPGWRGSDEWRRSVDMYRKMVDLQGTSVLGSDWMLACWYGRGSTKNQILEKKRTMSPVAFSQNYGGRWTGSSDGALVDINKLLACRTLEFPVMEAQKESDEYYMGIDVARSQNTNNNQSSIVVGKVNRDKETNRIKSIDIVNVVNIPNLLNFQTQGAIIKRTALKYRPKMVICDGNGLGSGLIDKLLESNVDPLTKERYDCWDTVNTDNIPEERGAPKCLYDIKAQGVQSRIITNFIDMVDSGKLKLLCKRNESELVLSGQTDFTENVMPYVQTDLLFEEVANLKLKYQPSGALSIEKVVRKIDKDRFSALAYMLYYISEYASDIRKKKKASEFEETFSFKAPNFKKGGLMRFGRNQ